MQDCAGTWGGSAVEASYYFDSDGDGLGSGSAATFCDAFVTDGWVDNANDTEPNCATNDTDDCGVCGGGNADDLGCGCFESGPSGCDNTCGST